MPVDYIKRFSSTPLAATLTLNGATVRVETNDPLVLDRLQRASEAIERDLDDEHITKWRIVVEEEDDASDDEFTSDGFTYGGLSFIRIAYRSFLASDLQARCGISFLDKNLIRNERLFEQHFLPALMSMLEVGLIAPVPE